MRLAFLSTHPIQYQAPLFVEMARRSGVELTVLFCNDHGVRPSLDIQFGKVIRYDVPLLEGYEHRFLSNVARRPRVSPTGLVNPEILALLTRGEFDACVVHGYDYITSLMAFLGPRRHTRLLLRGESHLVPRRSLSTRVVKQVFLRTLFSRIDHFLPIGTLNRAYYASYGVPASRMTLAPYAVDNGYFFARSAEARRDPSATRRRLGVPDSIPLFLFAAKLIPKKRPLDALRAFAKVRTRSRSGLLYVGDGAMAGDLDREIVSLGLERDVFRLGFRNQSELPAIYGACDVLVLPSDNEPWGLVVNEAMACGLAAIVSDHVGSGPDLVDPQHTFPAGDVDRLAEIMATLAGDSAHLAAARAAAAARIAGWDCQHAADGILRGVRTAIAA
jgi:glycosyltransferase involved in cell wall biosynthesis